MGWWDYATPESQTVPNNVAAAGWMTHASPEAPKPTQPVPTADYSSAIWPLSVDTAGHSHFDLGAGLTGMLGRAATLPGDVAFGKTPIFNAGGQYNPDLINRSAEFAGLVSPVNPAMRAGDLAFPGETMAAMRQSQTSSPTVQALMDAKNAGYKAAADAGFEAEPQAIADFALGVQNSLTREGFGADVAPGTHGIVGKIANPHTPTPDERVFATVSDLDAMRRNLGNVTATATDRAAARSTIRKLDEFLNTLDPSSVVAGTAAPEEIAALLKNARANYAAAQRSNDITGTLDRATTGIGERAEASAHAANSGLNIDNAIRQGVKSFTRSPDNLAGFSQPEIDALNDVIKGGFWQNRLRQFGNLFGGGGGLGSIAAGAAGAMGGGHLFGPDGGALGAVAVPLAGLAMKTGANALARRGLANADDIIRQNSPLYRQTQSEQPFYNPGLDRNAAALRALLLGLQQQRQPSAAMPLGGAQPARILYDPRGGVI